MPTMVPGLHIPGVLCLSLHPGYTTLYIHLSYTLGIPPCIYTSLTLGIPPDVHLLHTLGIPPKVVVHEAHSPLYSPKG